MGRHCQNQDSVITVVWFFFHFPSTLNVSSRESESQTKLRHSSFHLCAFWNSSFSVWGCYYYLGIGVGRGWGMGVTYIYLKDLTFSCFTVTSTAQLQISYDGWHPYHIHTEKHGHRHAYYTFTDHTKENMVWYFMLVMNRLSFQHPHQKFILISYGLWVDFQYPSPYIHQRFINIYYHRLKCKAYINRKINNYIGYTNVGIKLKVWGW